MTKRWTEIAQLTHDWDALAAYDNPLHAFCIGTVTSPIYVGHEEWAEWIMSITWAQTDMTTRRAKSPIQS